VSIPLPSDQPDRALVPIRPLADPGYPPLTDLPVPLTPPVGGEREAAALVALLRRAGAAGTPPPEEGPPTFLLVWAWFGGVDDTAPGRRAQALLDLAPGEARVLVPLTIVPGPATPPVASAEPSADATIQMQEYAYVGLPARVAPGRRVWKITNAGTMPHEFYVAKAPDGTTLEQVQSAFSQPPGASPAPGGFDPSTLASLGGMAGLSPRRVGWAVLDLEAGTYVAFCFYPDPQTGVPHAVEGMVAVFTVGEAGTPAP
jgi:hypothetical protein